ncbi:MAG: hypothetical protein V8R99_02085 [Eubacterium ventriosum]|uniref:hypothetical protein n=1 Tax=Eubacterium ventriosum TaxID=39496 RepID=UPI00300F5E37
MSDKEYKKLLKQYHKLSDRHILVVETDMPYPDVLKVVALSDKIRKAGNELVSLMRKNYDQLMRTKKYRKLLKLYGNTEDKDKLKALANQLNDMQKSYNVTWDFCRTSMIPIGKKYSIDAVFALTKAEDIWRGMEKLITVTPIHRQSQRSDGGGPESSATTGQSRVRRASDRQEDADAVIRKKSRPPLPGAVADWQPPAAPPKERLYYRAMDRSRRATNPQNYNPDGTIKKGKKTWKYSNHYKKLKAKHAELCRINAVNRQLAINEDANYLRSLGDTFVTEPKNASKLMKRAKKTTVNSKGKFNKKKRFGKSIKNRCPSGFQTTVEKKFKVTGGAYIEVSNNYRASQYDHTADDYIKKKLSDRLYRLRDGTLVQRDWYSSFLLYCYDYRTQDIDKDKCITDFGRCYDKEKALIAWIKANHIKILNSGIKVA